MWQVRGWARIGWSILAAAVLLVGGCSGTYPVEVQSSWGPGIKFTDLGSTFEWVADAKTAGSPRAGTPQVHELVLKTVEEQLAAKGYEKTSTGKPDFRLDYRVAKAMLGDVYGDATHRQYPEGSLVLYVIDPVSGKWIWRSVARGRLTESNSQEAMQKRLREVVQKMLKDVSSKGGKPSAGGPRGEQG